MQKTLVAVVVCPMFLVGSLSCKRDAPPPSVPPPIATVSPTTAAPAPVAVSTVTLGNAIGADKKVVAPSETFGPKDTIYASVETTGAGQGKLRALWSFVKGDQTAKVDETTIELNTTAPTVNEFHVSKPSGWPVGDYRVEIFLGDAAAPAMTKTFRVG
jgi:hypothetical protein